MANFSSDKILQDVVDSGILGRSKRQYDLFKYLLEKSLAGEADNIKAYTIAVDLFDRPPDFDDTTDSIVRVEMHRLRKNLKSFNRQGSYRLDIPRASYEVRILPSAYEPKTSTDPAQSNQALQPAVSNDTAPDAHLLQPQPSLMSRAPSYLLPVLAAIVLLAVVVVTILNSTGGFEDTADVKCSKTTPMVYVVHKEEPAEDIPEQLTSFMLDLFSSANSSYSIVDIVTNEDCAHAIDYVLSFSEMREHDLEYELSFILRDVSTKNVIWSSSLFVPKNYTTDGLKDIISGVLYQLMDSSGIVPDHAIQNLDWESGQATENYICSQQAKVFINTEFFEAQDMLLQCMNEGIESGTATADMYATFMTILQYERKKYIPQKTWNREEKIKDAILNANLLNPYDVQFTLSLYREFRDSDNISRNELHGIIDNSITSHRFNPYMRAQTARMNALYMGNWEDGKSEIENARLILKHPDYFIYFELAYGITTGQYEDALTMANKHHPFVNPIYEIHAAVVAHKANDVHLLKKSVARLRESGFHSISQVKKTVLDSKYDKIFERKLIEGLDEISQRQDMQEYWPRPEPL